MPCNCPTCKGRPAQTRYWCIEEKKHVTASHWRQHRVSANSRHTIATLGLEWPPRKRPVPKRMSNRLVRAVRSFRLPTEVDLIPLWTSVGYPQPNQGSIGNCTAQTTVLDLALMKIKQTKFIKAFSAAFIYAWERIDNGDFPNDTGAYMADEGECLAQHGACYESTMPTSQTSCSQLPSAAADEEAANYKCNPNQKPIDYRDFMQALDACQKDPLLGSVRMGFPVGNSFFDAATNGGWVPNTPSNDGLAGGHSQLCGSLRLLKGPKDTAPRLYASFIQTWGLTGDMSRGISEYKLQYPEFWETAFVKSYGGVDCYQQPDLPGADPDHPCPEGQHWSEEDQACVDNEPEPQPTDCMAEENKCMVEADKEPDLLTKFILYIICMITAVLCELGYTKGKAKLLSYLGSKKTKSMSRRIPTAGLKVTVTLERIMTSAKKKVKHR